MGMRTPSSRRSARPRRGAPIGEYLFDLPLRTKRTTPSPCAGINAKKIVFGKASIGWVAV